MSFLSRLFPCFRDDPPPPVNRTSSSGWTIGPIIGGVNYSPGVAWTGDGFVFPRSAPGVHYVTRPVAEAGRSTITLRFAIEGDATFLEVDSGGGPQGPGLIRLYIQRSADDWSGQGPMKSYRFWSPPMALGLGEQVIAKALRPELWTNVVGEHDADGFSAAMNNLDVVGFTFGGTFAGHGVYATGPARFILREYTVS